MLKISIRTYREKSIVGESEDPYTCRHLGHLGQSTFDSTGKLKPHASMH